MRVVVVADTHSRPHPKLGERLAELRPRHIAHAGDIGDPAVLEELARHAAVTAVRGNIDALGLPDVDTIEFRSDGGASLKILLTHIAVDGVRLRADVLRLAKEEDAGLVVCGHSHVPLLVTDRGVGVFNPGSVGPRRFQLPIVFGVIEVRASGLAFRHVECETGRDWRP